MKPRSRRLTDWARVRERLAGAIAASEEALEPSPQRARAIMDERARRLAEARIEPEPPTDRVELLCFSIGPERYALESKYVREVVRFVEATPVPGAAEPLVGIINLRGQILAIVDLHASLGLARPQARELACVVILGDDRPELGIVVDAAHELRSIPVAAILDPPESVAGIGREMLLGITKDALVVLDGARLLSDSCSFGGFTCRNHRSG